jgi:Pyruvate/2-oxoacid:ferredoxin oxidoreductase gamma subunit
MKGYITLIISSLFFISYSQVSVIHFNSEWNADNNYDISILKDCEKSDVVICHNPDLQEKHNIFAVPTIIILDNDIEIARFEANIMMQLEATKKEIQNTIDQIYLAKFE